MNKTIKYGTNLAIAGGVGNGVVNIIKQLNVMTMNPRQKFDWKSLLIAVGKGGLVGGGIGLFTGAIVDYQNSMEKPIDTDAFLFSFVNAARLTKQDSSYISLDHKAEQLIHLFLTHFQTELASDPMKGGSSEKGTALKDHFDIDIYLPFKSGSFTSTRQMIDEVYSFLQRHQNKHEVIGLRQQGKSVGVFFMISGKELKIDVVPYKITKAKENKTSGYLHVRKRTVWGERSTYTKTDIQALNSIKLTKTQKKILIVLKTWKTKNDLPVSSHLLQNLILDAYAYNTVPRTFTKKIIMVLQHIADNLDLIVIRSVENTNNVLTNIPIENKARIVKACKEAIEKYKYQSNSIIDLVS